MTILQVFNGYCDPVYYDVVIETDRGFLTVDKSGVIDRETTPPSLFLSLTGTEKRFSQTLKENQMKNDMYVLALTNSCGLVPGDFVKEMDIDTHSPTWIGNIKKAMRGTIDAMKVLAELLNKDRDGDRVVLVQSDSYVKPKFVTK